MFLLCINDELGYFNEDIPRPLAGSLAHGERKRRERPTSGPLDRHVPGHARSASFYWRIVSLSTRRLSFSRVPLRVYPPLIPRVSQLFRYDIASVSIPRDYANGNFSPFPFAKFSSAFSSSAFRSTGSRVIRDSKIDHRDRYRLFFFFPTNEIESIYFHILLKRDERIPERERERERE